jgi:hypothetical protein
MVKQALADARIWCRGQVIDDRPALVHAVRVAVTLARHVPDAPASLIAAVLLHDSPEFAPPGLDLDRYLIAGYGHPVQRIIRRLQAEHEALDQPDPPIHVDDLPVLLAGTADRIVALRSLTHRANKSGDPNAFFTRRGPLLDLLPYFRACQQAAHGRIPGAMSDALALALDQLADTAGPVLREREAQHCG